MVYWIAWKSELIHSKNLLNIVYFYYLFKQIKIWNIFILKGEKSIIKIVLILLSLYKEQNLYNLEQFIKNFNEEDRLYDIFKKFKLKHNQKSLFYLKKTYGM